MTVKLNLPLAAPVNDAGKRLTELCESIAPIWPLDRWIAVNPWWGLRRLPVEAASRRLRREAGVGMLMPPSFYRSAFASGRIRESDLYQAARELAVTPPDSPKAWLAMLTSAGEPERQVYSALEFLPPSGDGVTPLASARDHLGRFCARYFDRRQARWPGRADNDGLFSAWLRQARRDRSLEKQLGLADLRTALADLPDAWPSAAEWALSSIPLASEAQDALARRLLHALLGWASWCRGEDWRAGLEGRASSLCAELLTAWLVLEALTLSALGTEQKAAWQRRWASFAQSRERDGDLTGLWLWHRAYELAWLREFGGKLATRAPVPRDGELAVQVPAIQAVFCIDVRSEVFRRHLEEGRPGIQTLGFAGFFGMPISHRVPGPEGDSPRLPGLMAPTYRFVESTGNLEQDLRLGQRLDQKEAIRDSVRRAKYSSLSTFTLVETTGLAWAWKLVKDSLGRKRTRHETDASPQREGRLCHLHGGDPLSDPERVALAESVLRGMSLTRNFGSLLVLVGHGSHTDNNPNEAGLACGACCGKNGGVNARAAANLLNDRTVRAGLRQRGIRLPDHCWVLAAEHCTVTDQVRILDRDQVPDSHLLRLQELEQAFAEAGRAARRERASTLGLNGLDDEALLAAMTRRTSNWAEVRPEWGLAGNAAIVFAQRHRTRGINLKGRCFLHDYDADQDPDAEVLTRLLSAPMIVANWINLQYFASMTNPEVYGAGNKLLHSVVGGHLGVVEGNGTDLRIGLPIQSLHDGRLWRHEPLRLNVVVDAPEDSIRRAVAAHPDVSALVRNRWLWLFRLDDSGELVPLSDA
jgi:uncharacterized protein YbcC (UPF0753/DUF2309 family)